MSIINSAYHNFVSLVKNNIMIVILALSFMFILSSINASVVLLKNTNHTGKKIKSLNKFFEDTYNGYSFEPYINNTDYKIALIENPETDEEVTKDYSGYTLKDFYFLTSSNTIICDKLYDGYINIDIIDTVLKYGSRALILDIFSDSYCEDGMPVVSNSNPSYFFNANDPGTYNYINFSEVCLKIKERNDSLPNNRNLDPLFIILKLHINNKKNLRNNIMFHLSKILKETFEGQLLCEDFEYAYGRTPLGDIPIEDTFKKVILLASNGFRGTDLEELITYSWEENYSDESSKSPSFFNSYYTSTTFNQLDSSDLSYLKKYNKVGMSIIDSFSGLSKIPIKYNIQSAWSYGCQFIGVDFSNKNLIQDYIQKFTITNEINNKETNTVYSISLKSCPDPKDTKNCLRSINIPIVYNPTQNSDYSMDGRKIQSAYNVDNFVI